METIDYKRSRVDHDIKVVSLPREYQKCPMDHFLSLIARMLSSLIYMNDYKLRAQEISQHKANTQSHGSPDDLSNKGYLRKTALTGDHNNEFHQKSGTPLSSTSSNMTVSVSGIVLTRFHSKTPPEISIYDYLYRLTKYSSLDHSVLLATLSYIDLLMLACPAFEISSLTVHRFLLAATTVACKGLRDSFYPNEHYAKVGGVHVSELNILEQELLKQINYRILPRDFSVELLKWEIDKKKFVVFRSDISGNQLCSDDGYGLLSRLYENMVKLVGRYEAVMYVSDRLPVYFGPAEQQALLKTHRKMWSKDINFIANSKHKISYLLKNGEPEIAPYINSDSVEKSYSNYQSSKDETLRRNKQSSSPRTTGSVEHTQQTAGLSNELLEHYFKPELFKQTQIYNNTRSSPKNLRSLNTTEKCEENTKTSKRSKIKN